MSEEGPQPHEPFGFTEREKLFYRVSDARFQTLIEDEQTTIHSVELSANDYGEFLFVIVSLPEQAGQPVGERGSAVTFWGYGYHEHRDRWIMSEWFWYEAFSRPELLEQVVDKATAHKVLEVRRESVQSDAGHHRQSERGKWFDQLADLTDDDETLALFEDFPDFFEDDWT